MIEAVLRVIVGEALELLGALASTAMVLLIGLTALLISRFVAWLKERHARRLIAQALAPQPRSEPVEALDLGYNPDDYIDHHADAPQPGSPWYRTPQERYEETQLLLRNLRQLGYNTDKDKPK